MHANKEFAIEPSKPRKAAKLTIFSDGGAAITTTGPRGGDGYMSISQGAMPQVAKALVEHLTGQFVCSRCFRPEEDCSANPCKAVLADRAA